jgi:S-DNA-T family DNA segregation ATPase FtsK/SpoIIIE
MLVGAVEVVPGDRLRTRPAPEVWSPLEYACHVRDVLLVQRERVLLAQVEDQPEFVPMRRDERAVGARYNEQDPVTVLAAIPTAADDLAATLDGLDATGWARSGIYTYPERAVRSIEWIGRHTLHELRHHQGDIERGGARPAP